MQAVSLAETTELAVKASKRPVVKGISQNKGPNQSNRGRGFWRGGMGRGRGQGGGKTGNSGGWGRGSSGGRGGKSGSSSFDPLACYSVGCVAIWPMTVPNPKASRWEAAQVALPEELFLNPGKKAHREDVDVVGKSDSQASTSCTTMRVILTPSMM